jgi:adenylosuccinate lyase
MLASVHITDSSIYGSAWVDDELRGLFTEQYRIASWLDIMRVLAQTQADYGLIPQPASREIDTACRGLDVDQAFLDEVGEGFKKTNHSLLGLIEAIKKRCGVAGGEWLCYGATVQDITDTHIVCVLLKAHQHFLAQVRLIQQSLIELARQHKNTLMCGRTHAQPGLPITFGFKAAAWLDEWERHRQRLTELKPRLGVGQLCGGVGSLSAFGPQALALQKTVMSRLGLEPPIISWTSSRDRFAEWLAVLALMASTGDRIGQEIVHLQRPEIGELSEGLAENAVGSITMPQKRNPEISEHLGTLARVVRHHAAHMAENLVHSHERDGRSWKGEWLIIPDATLATGKSLALLANLVKNLQVNKDRMRANIVATKGFIHAEAVMLKLAESLGKQSAHKLVFEVSVNAQNQGQDFKQALLEHPVINRLINGAAMQELFDLEKSTAICAEMIDQVISQCSLS